MKQFKNIFIFGIIVLFLVGVMIIREAAPSRTVDFRGEVLTVARSEDGVLTLSATDVFGGDFLFRLDDDTELYDCCGEKITADDLYKGASVDINYRKYLFREEEVHTVKTLKLWSEISKGE